MSRSRAAGSSLLLAVLLAVSACKPSPVAPEPAPTPEPARPALPDSALEAATVGAAYSKSLSAMSGVAPLVYSAAVLPAGLALTADTGVLSGSPSAAGDFTFDVSVTDARGRSTKRSYELKVFPSPAISTGSTLADGYAGEAYSVTLAASGGRPPLVWTLAEGSPPPGLSLSSEGTLSGTLSPEASPGQTYTFTVGVKEANGVRMTRALTVTTYTAAQLTSASLTQATEGVTYRQAPGTPERLSAQGGKAPLQLAVTGLPAGLSFDPSTGTLSGAPALDSAGTHEVRVAVTDANDKVFHRTLPLTVVAPQPLKMDGTVGIEPAGSPITDRLTVFVVDEGGAPRQGVGVRVRKNGTEYQPAREVLSDARGRAHLTGLGLNGTTDTVDITANGAGLWNVTLARVNASLVTLVMPAYPLPLPRIGASATFDEQDGGLLVTMGRNDSSNRPSPQSPPCINDLVSLSNVSSGAWSEAVPPGLDNAPSARFSAGFQYVGQGVSVLFGGEDCASALFGDTWQYDSASRAWTRVDTSAGAPSARKEVAMARSSVDGELLVFGGHLGMTTTRPNNPIPSNELWAYRPSSRLWEQLAPSGTGPSARYGAAAALDTTTQDVWVCGGTGLFWNSPAEQSNCFRYSRSNNSWQAAPALPETRTDLAMAYRPGDGLYVFGGVNAGAARNDLLRYHPDTGWTRVIANGASGAPPATRDATLVYEPTSRNLLLFLGQRAEVWSFDGTSWTKRASSTVPRTFTVSGTVTRPVTYSYASTTVWATSAAGFSTTSFFVPMGGGQGRYTLADRVPAGTVLSVGLMVQDGSAGWTYLDVGEVGPITEDTTLDIAVPAATTPYAKVTGTYSTPAYWPTGVGISQYQRAVVRKPGQPSRQSGPWNTFGQLTVDFDAFSLAAPHVQWGELRAESRAPQACESLTTYVHALTPGSSVAVALPEGPRNLAPGLNQCTTGSAPPSAPEGTYQFTAPAGTRVWTALRGASLMTWDWKYVSPGQPGPTTFSFPLPSTLAPARPTPSGQHAAWSVTAYTFSQDARFDERALRWNDLEPSGKAESLGHRFVRQ